MPKDFYGIDPDKKLTPLMVRDAIIECFRQAHCLDSGIAPDDKEVNNVYCKEIVTKAFVDSGGDFDNPTKDGIMGALEKLADFSKKFRDPKIIEKHYSEMMALVNRLK